MAHVSIGVNDIKKIVYVTESMASGVLTYINELANGLSNNAKIYILYGERKQTPNNLKALFNNNIKLIKINNFQRSLSVKKDFKAYLELKHIIYYIEPDIVHLNSSKAGALGRILRLIHFKKIKFFYTPHGYSFLMQDSLKIKRIIYYLVEWLLSKLGTTTIACGKSEYIQAKKLSNNSVYVNNGIDVEHLKKFFNEQSNTEDVIFTIGRINEQKGPYLFNQIALHFPNEKFVWVGDGPLKSYLTSPNIEITGWLSSNEVLNKIQPYKTFILCSKWEGLPISLLESMYYKKLCLVTNVIGNTDVIIDKYNGLIFKNINDFIYQLTRQNYNPNLLNKANYYVYNNYNLFKMVKKYEKLYKIINL